MNNPLYNEKEEKKLLDEIQDLTSTINNDVDNPELYYQRGLTYYQLSQQYYDIFEDFSFVGNKDKYYEYVNQAYEDISKALSFNIKDRRINYFRIFMLKKLKRWEDLVHYGQKLLEEYDGTFLDHSLLGEAYFHLEDWENCIKYYSMVLEYDESYAKDAKRILIERGYAYYSIGEPKLAVEDYLKYVELNGVSEFDKYDVNHALALAYQKIGTIESLTKAIELESEAANLYFHRGVQYCDNVHDYYLATLDFDKAIEYAEEESFMYYHYCGYAYVHKGVEEEYNSNYEQALKDYDKAIYAYNKEVELTPLDNNGEYTVNYAEQLKRDLLEKMREK